MPRTAVRAIALPLLIAVGPVACDAATDNPSTEISVTTNALVITNCTGAAIAAAVAAGGDVLLDCGPNPIVVSVPATNVTLPTRLHPVIAGSVTLTCPSLLFSVTNNATFEIDNLKFAIVGPSSSAIATNSGSTTVIGSTFTGFQSFALNVQNPALLTVTARCRSFSRHEKISRGW